MLYKHVAAASSSIIIRKTCIRLWHHNLLWCVFFSSSSDHWLCWKKTWSHVMTSWGKFYYYHRCWAGGQARRSLPKLIFYDSVTAWFSPHSEPGTGHSTGYCGNVVFTKQMLTELRPCPFSFFPCGTPGMLVLAWRRHASSSFSKQLSIVTPVVS